MMDKEVELPAIKEVIFKHLPMSHHKASEVNGNLFTRADFYASGISGALDYRAYLGGLGWDAVEMENLVRSLNQSLASMERMHRKTIGIFRWFDDAESCKKRVKMNGHNFFEMVEEARDMAAQAQKFLGNLPSGSQKRNWEAVSLVKECRNVWAEEHWAMMNGEWGEGPSYESFIEEFPPKTQNHYRPGPFGRFVEDIFELCHVLSETGATVSAATALESLQSYESQEDHLKRFVIS